LMYEDEPLQRQRQQGSERLPKAYLRVILEYSYKDKVILYLTTTASSELWVVNIPKHHRYASQRLKPAQRLILQLDQIALPEVRRRAPKQHPSLRIERSTLIRNPNRALLLSAIIAAH